MISHTEIEPVFERLWETLIHQCPNLRQLSILTQGPAEPINSIDARLLFSGDHWPHLRFWNWATSKSVPFWTTVTLTLPPLFSLHGITFERYTSPAILRCLPRDALQDLRYYSGSIDQLSSLPSAKNLLSVELPSPSILRAFTPLTVSQALQAAPVVRPLKVFFVLQSGYDGIGILKSIATVGAHTRHLDLTFCTNLLSYTLLLIIILSNTCTRAKTPSVGNVLTDDPTPLQTSDIKSDGRESSRG